MCKGTSFKLIDIDVYAISAFGKNKTSAAIEGFGRYPEKGEDQWPINMFL